MAPPDINSLASLSSRTRTPSNPLTMQERSTDETNTSPSLRPSAMSLATAASLNSATESSARRSPSNTRGSPRLRGRVPSDRRRSQVLMNLSLNDPTIPSPGELAFGDQRRQSGSFMPQHHDRQPSLGDIHNELEQEQEAQVNRMLGLIRTQQAQLDALRAAQTGGEGQAGNTAVLDDLTPQSERSATFPSVHPAVSPIPRSQQTQTQLPTRPAPETSSLRPTALRQLSGQDQHHNSGQIPHWPPSPADSSSPNLSARRNSSSRRSSIRERDETAYYQAETANLQRENQMLRMRIRELEKQLNEQRDSHGDENVPVRRSSLAVVTTESEETD